MSEHALPPELLQLGSDPTLLRDELLHVITRRIAAAPRSQQKRIGPSEIGSPCPRRIAYKLAGAEATNTTSNGWKATVGTGAHWWLEDCFTNDNTLTANGVDNDTRWLTEATVTAGSINGIDIDGSCDLYDRITATVIDWKTTSRAKIKSYRVNGPGEQYRVQAHAYGNGWLAKGLPVERVAVVFLPRDDDLRPDTMHMWSEAHQPQIALDAFARASGIDLLVDGLGLPKALTLIPTAQAYCGHCDYFRAGSTDLARGCPGDATWAEHNSTAPALTFST